MTVIIPAIDMNLEQTFPVILMMLERCCLVFAVAIPFDIRDLSIDTENKVQTLPQKLGIRHAKILAYSALGLMCCFASLSYRISAYNMQHLLAIGTSAVATGTLIFFTHKEKSDYFFSGAIDGMLLLQFPLLLLF